MKTKLDTIFYTCFIFSFFFISCRSAKSNSIDSYCLAATKNFFNRVGTPNYAAALDSLLLSNRNINFMDSGTIQLREGFKTINERSGNYLGYKLLRKRIVEEDIAIYSYLVKYEKKFYRFIFLFYKPRDKVSIYKFAYDDVLELELEESIKLYSQ